MQSQEPARGSLYRKRKDPVQSKREKAVKAIREESCAGSGGGGLSESVEADTSKIFPVGMTTARYALAGIPVLAAWWVLYEHLELFAGWLARRFAGWLSGYGLSSASVEHLRSMVQFFVFEGPKVLMLLLLVVFAVGVVRSFFSPEKTRRILAGKRESVGNVLAALLGVVTPFCSCSACPLWGGDSCPGAHGLYGLDHG